MTTVFYELFLHFKLLETSNIEFLTKTGPLFHATIPSYLVTPVRELGWKRRVLLITVLFEDLLKVALFVDA